MKYIILFLSLYMLSACGLDVEEAPRSNGVQYLFSNGSSASGFFENSVNFVITRQPTILRLKNPDGTLTNIELNIVSFPSATNNNQHVISLPNTLGLSPDNNVKDINGGLIVGQINISNAFIILSTDLSNGVIALDINGFTYSDTLFNFIVLNNKRLIF